MKNGKEKIKVYIDFVNGETCCICERSRKMCDKTTCVPDVVERDAYRGWKETMEVDRYGHWKGENDDN